MSAIELFDDQGDFTGPVTFDIFGATVRDAGTEVNVALDGGAFLDGVDGTGGTPEGGVVHLFFSEPGASAYLDSIVGLTTADGGVITTTFDEATLLGRITVVPGPGTAVAIGLLGLLGRRRRRRA